MKTNKNILAAMIISAGAIGFTSCSDKKEREQLKQQAELLEQRLHEKDSAFNEIMTVMSSVENQISEIKEKENIVSLKSKGDLSESEKSQMIHDMESIDLLIANSRQTIQNLSEKLDKADMSINSFNKRVRDLNKSLESRENSIAELKEMLIEKDVQIATLDAEVQNLNAHVGVQTETIDMQVNKINEQEEKINTAYFVVAPEKNLRSQGIVAKEGGFLWMGRTTELQDNVAKEQFVEIDIRDTSRLLIDSEKIELVTDHPTDSYELVKNGDVVQYINIKNPERFWELSKVLVVSIKG